MKQNYCISISWFSILLTLFVGFEIPVAFSTAQSKDCPSILSEADCQEGEICCCAATIEDNACCDAPDQSLVLNSEKCTCHVITKQNQPVPQARYSYLSQSTEKQKECDHTLNGYSADGISYQINVCTSCSNHIIPCPSSCIEKVRLRL